jgi:hypothetical protein
VRAGNDWPLIHAGASRDSLQERRLRCSPAEMFQLLRAACAARVPTTANPFHFFCRSNRLALFCGEGTGCLVAVAQL